MWVSTDRTRPQSLTSWSMPSVYSVLAPEMDTSSTAWPIQASGTDAFPSEELIGDPAVGRPLGSPGASLGDDQPGASARSRARLSCPFLCPLVSVRTVAQLLELTAGLSLHDILKRFF